MIRGADRARLGRARLCLVAVALCCALACALAAGGASAATTTDIATGFADPEFSSPSEATREQLMDQAVEAGSTYIRIVVSWRFIAYGKPDDPADPGDRAYRFQPLDRVVQEADARGLEVLFTLHAAPDWATRPGLVKPSPASGTAETWAPDPEALGDFATALASRYSGSYVPHRKPATTTPLPRVQLYEPWNEPNVTGFLSPQWVGGEPVSPLLYRAMLNSVYDAVHAVQPDATVIAGSTAPQGETEGPARRVAPLEFLRRLLCLRQAGAQLRATRCPNPARFDVLSHHPIMPTRAPSVPYANGFDAGVADMSEISRILAVAEGARTTYPLGLHRELWATEMWWETNPPIPAALYGAPSEDEQADYIADAFRLLSQQGVSVALLFQVRDSAAITGPPRSGWATGILFADGTRKQSFRSVRLPFVATRIAPKVVSTWTRAPKSGRLRLVASTEEGSATVAVADVTAGEVVERDVRLKGDATMTAWIGGEHSNPWPVEDAGPPLLPPDTTAPRLQLSGSKSQRLGRLLKMEVGCNEDCTVKASGTLAAGSDGGAGSGTRAHRSLQLDGVKAAIVARHAATLKLQLTRRARKLAKRTLADGMRLRAELTLAATDEAGNKATAAWRVRVVGPCAAGPRCTHRYRAR